MVPLSSLDVVDATKLAIDHGFEINGLIDWQVNKRRSLRANYDGFEVIRGMDPETVFYATEGDGFSFTKM